MAALHRPSLGHPGSSRSTAYLVSFGRVHLSRREPSRSNFGHLATESARNTKTARRMDVQRCPDEMP
eukprot:3257266-Pyramimonas_sp.AAC.1